MIAAQGERWAAAERVAVQLPRARWRYSHQKRHDLAREAVGCNGVFGRFWSSPYL